MKTALVNLIKQYSYQLGVLGIVSIETMGFAICLLAIASVISLGWYVLGFALLLAGAFSDKLYDLVSVKVFDKRTKKNV